MNPHLGTHHVVRAQIHTLLIPQSHVLPIALWEREKW